MTMGVWVILHSIVWNGEVSRDEDLPFPFNIISQLMKGDNDAIIHLKEAKLKQDTSDILHVSNLTQYISPEDRLSGSSLSELSLNNLINFVTDPAIGATSLVISAGLVNVFIISIHILTNVEQNGLTITQVILFQYIFRMQQSC